MCLQCYSHLLHTRWRYCLLVLLYYSYLICSLVSVWWLTIAALNILYNSWTLLKHVDADHACDPDTRRSITGLILGPIIVKQSKQLSLVALSSMEANYISACAEQIVCGTCAVYRWRREITSTFDVTVHWAYVMRLWGTPVCMYYASMSTGVHRWTLLRLRKIMAAA